MGSYLNPGYRGFQESLNSKIYVDKTGLIRITNSVLCTQQKYLCVSRPRRFGKSMGLNMLAAYYGRGADSDELFHSLDIGSDASYREHLNQYDVIRINMQEFLSAADTVDDMLAMLKEYLLFDLEEDFADIRLRDRKNLIQSMKDIYVKTGRGFVILIDEWDCLFREYQNDKESQKKYLDFLRAWLKDQEFIALAYMTGILPIKKYGSHSALNMFTEYSMTNSRDLAPYFGFTEEEVRELCQEYQLSFEETKAWYDGYRLIGSDEGSIKEYSMYSPKSVVDAMMTGMLDHYWNQTETYEALKVYIQMNFNGLKDHVVKMLAGESMRINTGTFTNDMTTFQSADDVLTLLIHLGYLSYHWIEKTVSIPNKEVSEEYVTAIRTMDWSEISRSIENSRKLLEALWDMDGDAVAAGIAQAHSEISILTYNDENSLSCTIHLAFYFAREYYTIVRELPSGKGYADICLIPRRAYADKPAAVIELKVDESAEGAIAQIRERNYTEALREYQGNLLLAGISYDRKTKQHTCTIEKVEV